MSDIIVAKLKLAQLEIVKLEIVKLEIAQSNNDNPCFRKFSSHIFFLIQ